MDEVLHLKLLIGKYILLKGSQYFELPRKIAKTQCILNIQNNDDKCFLWSILAHLHLIHYSQNGYRVEKYIPYENELNMEGITYPVAVKDVPKFEKQNDISVNVFGYEDGYYPLYISRDQKERHVNHLLLEQKGKTHYCLIKDLNRMLYSQTKHKAQQYFYTYCLHGFTREDLIAHKPLCESHGPQCTVLADKKDRLMKFTQWGKKLKVPFVIYADFECILSPLPKESGKTHIHKPCGYSYLIVSAVDEEQPEIVCYRGKDGENVEHFFDSVLKESEHLIQHLKTNVPMNFTQEDEIVHNQSTQCHICGEEMESKDKLRDHCHLTGKYRGPAHYKCNLAFKYSKHIPVFFHNLEGYDSHLLMQDLGKYKEKKLSCIAKNTEKYISFELGDLQFLHGLNFINESLGKLVNNLATEGDDHFHHV